MNSKHYSKLQRFLSGFLAVLMVLILTVSAFAADMTDFNDISGHWAYDALTWAVDNGVLEGVTEHSLAPNDRLTRAQMAAMTSRLYGTYKCAEISQYTDADPESWYYSYIAQMVNMGTFTGYSQNRMGPGDYITREQAMTVLARIICLPTATNTSESLNQFSDRSSVASWAYDAVCGMVEREYVNGYKDGQLKPKEQITRAEMAQIMSHMFQSVHESGELTGNYPNTVLVRGAVNIHDAVFDGDLIIATGLRERKMELNNVTVKGQLIVWGGSEIRISGNSAVAGIVTPRNDGPVTVAFDETASGLSEQSCSIVYPDSMNKNNKVTFMEKSVPEVPKPTIDFTLPAYVYVGDSVEVKSIISNADSITWSLTKTDLGKPVDGLTKDGGKISFTQEGQYVLSGTVKNAGGASVCERTIKVLPVVGIFTLPEYGHTDTPIDVKLLLENGQDGDVTWTLTRDGMDYPMPDGFSNSGGTLILPETGGYTLTATTTDAAGKKHTVRQSITILPVIGLALTTSADNVHEDETVEIGLSVENGNPVFISWTLTCDGKNIDLSLSDNGGTLSFNGAGDYILTTTAKDAAGREFQSNPVSIHVIEKLAPMLTSDKDKLHEDETAEIHLDLENGTPSTVHWSMTCNGIDTPVSLGNDGGTLSFENAGDYILFATATDELGQEFTKTVSIKVYPVIHLTLEIPENIHADKPAAVHLNGNDLEDKTVVWAVKSERKTPIANTLGKDGGEISFPEPGKYTLTASVTDDLGRMFTASGAIEVRDTMRLAFQLPAFSHTDELIKVKMVSEHLEENQIECSLTVNDQPVNIADAIKGSLDNRGGSVLFTHSGTNVLTASVKDDLNWTYTCQQTIEVYPVHTLKLTADAAVHTDEKINVGLTKDTSLPVTWTVTPSNAPNAPNAVTDFTGTLSDNGSATWNPCDERQLVEDRQGDTLLARIAATDDSFRSDACTVIVPVCGASPMLLIDNETERMDCTAAMEYSGDNGETWISCLDNILMSDMTGKSLIVRYACDGVNPASKSTEITVPTRNSAPVPSIDTKTELLTATGTYPEYWTGDKWSALVFIGLDVSNLCGKEISVRESYDAEHFASLPVTIKVPGRGEKPDIAIDRDKQAIDTTADMEYSTDGGNTWVKCGPDMDVSNLTGETILVRKTATDDTFASEPTEVRIPNRTEKPDVALNTENETINTTPDMDYSTDGGKTWNPCTEPLDVSGMTEQTVLIRDHGDKDSFPSEGVPIAIPVRRDAPKIVVDNHAETVSSDTGTELSFDNGKTWRLFDKPLQTAEHKGETFLIRYPATKDDFASRTVAVIIPYRHGAPILTFDPDSETIDTTPGMEYSTDGGKTWKPISGPLDVSDLTGNDILVRYPSDGTDLPGESTTIKIPVRRKAPDVGHTDETRLGRNDGTLTETDRTMEYRVSGGRWTGITGNTVKNLAPGDYEIRYAATDMDVASFIQKVTIEKGKDSGNNADGNSSGNNGNNGNTGNLTGSKLALLNRKDHMSYISGRTATQAAPQADITRAEVAAILYRLLTADAKSAYTTKINGFSDVSSSAWYSTEVSTLANIGVIDGYQDGTFGPGRNITRGELATILVRFCDTADNSGADYFTDISGSWARQYINQAAKAGLVQGYSDGTFRPNQNIACFKQKGTDKRKIVYRKIA